MITVRQAAARLGLSVSRVHRLIDDGRIPGVVKVNGFPPHLLVPANVSRADILPPRKRDRGTYGRTALTSAR